MRRIPTILLLLAAVPAVLTAQDAPQPWHAVTKISALAYADYYTILEHHDEDLEGKNGFLLRRIYLTIDRTLSPSLSARLRFEANQPGDFTSSANLDPYVKDAWVRWQKSEALAMVVGISPTPTFDSIEQWWGYRAVEKTPLDLQRWSPSRDFGVALTGRVGTGNQFRYHVMAGNGAGTGSETNRGKQVSLLAGYEPSDAMAFEVYADHDSRPGESDRSTLQGFVGMRGERWRTGLQYAHQKREAPAGGDVDLDLASLFATWKVRDDLTALARIDRMFDPNPDGDRIAYLPFDPGFRSTLLIAGADFRLHGGLGVIPNVEWVMYDGGDGAPGDDVIPRLTFYYSY